MNQSIWQQKHRLPSFPALLGDMTADVVIIGGGLAGLLCARQMQQAGLHCVILEKDTVCSGITGNTTAKVTAQHGLIYHKIEQRYDTEAARLYLEANEGALEAYRSLCRTIDCGWQEAPNYVYSSDSAALHRELRALRRIKAPAEQVDTPEVPVNGVGAIRFEQQGQLDPLAFVSGILPGLEVYEQTRVTAVKPGRVITDQGTVSAHSIVVTTHFPILDRHGAFFLKQYQHRSYVIALEQAPLPEGMYVDDDPKGYSFRRAGDLLLLGGGGHRTGKPGGAWAQLRAFAREHYPEAREVAHWAAQDCMTLDGIPYIGQYSRRTPGLYVATGFNKWGMTTAMAAGMVLTDLVQGKENPYETLFSPSRTMLHWQLGKNGLEAMVSLLRPTVPRCSHMGCALRYNKAEHTWDCPCHGSRFAPDGRVLDNPAEYPG